MYNLLTCHYVKEIKRSLKSKLFTRNMLLRTKSDFISELLNHIFNSDSITLAPDSSCEFIADIKDNGETVELFSNNGAKVDTNKFWGIIIYLLKYYFNADKIALPLSLSEKIGDIANKLDMTVIYCGVSESEQLKEAEKHKLYIQERLLSDGIFLAVSLIDYLNHNKVSFDTLLSSIPDSYTYSASVKSNVAIEKISDLLSDCIPMMQLRYRTGVKLYKSNGWILIVPDNQRKSITIITEGDNTEIAEELCIKAVNKIKTCKF